MAEEDPRRGARAPSDDIGTHDDDELAAELAAQLSSVTDDLSRVRAALRAEPAAQDSDASRDADAAAASERPGATPPTGGGGATPGDLPTAATTAAPNLPGGGGEGEEAARAPLHRAERSVRLPARTGPITLPPVVPAAGTDLAAEVRPGDTGELRRRRDVLRRPVEDAPDESVSMPPRPRRVGRRAAVAVPGPAGGQGVPIEGVAPGRRGPDPDGQRDDPAASADARGVGAESLAAHATSAAEGEDAAGELGAPSARASRRSRRARPSEPTTGTRILPVAPPPDDEVLPPTLALDVPAGAAPVAPTGATGPAPVAAPPRVGAGLSGAFALWIGALACPAALLLGLVLAGPDRLLAPTLAAGLLLAVPAIARVASSAVRTGRGTAGISRAALGGVPGSVFGVVVLAGRLLAAALVLGATAGLLGAWADRTGVVGTLPTPAVEVGGIVLTGFAALGVAALPRRAAVVALLSSGAIGALTTVALLIVVPPDAPSGVAPPVLASGVAAFALLGLLVAGAAAEVARGSLRAERGGSSGSATAVGSVLAALGALLVVGAGARLSGGAAPRSAPRPDADLIGRLADATPLAAALPIAVLLVVSSVTLPALLLRSSGSLAVDLAGAGRSRTLAVVAGGLVAVAVALAVPAVGAGPADLALRVGLPLAVPLAAWAGVVAAAPLPLGSPPRAVVPASIGVVLGVIAGLLLLDGPLAGAAAPLLSAAGLGFGSPWRSTGAVALVAALLLGAAGGAIARLGRRSAPGDARVADPAREQVVERAG